MTAAGRRRAFFVPGRIEVLGKHTDYAGGRSLLCATERGFKVMVNPRADSTITVTDAASGANDLLALDPELTAARGHWSAYPRAVARRVARNFPRARRGADIVFENDLPQAAGLSSSSAFITSIFFALAAVNELEEDETYASAIRSREDLAAYLACVENGASFGPLEGDRGVGTCGGSEDHVAMLCCERGQLRVYAFCPPRFDARVAMPAGWVFAVAASGVSAQKTGAAMEAYNRAAADAATVRRRLQAIAGREAASLAAAVAGAPDAVSDLRQVLRSEPRLLGRFEQFLEESLVIVPRAAEALASRDLATFGALVDRSQRLAEDGLRNQVPETVALARRARELGAAAASAFGAGFGGSVWALVPAREADRFVERWQLAYRREFPEPAARATFFTTWPGAGALEV